MYKLFGFIDSIRTDTSDSNRLKDSLKKILLNPFKQKKRTRKQNLNFPPPFFQIDLAVKHPY